MCTGIVQKNRINAPVYGAIGVYERIGIADLLHIMTATRQDDGEGDGYLRIIVRADETWKKALGHELLRRVSFRLG